ncbi:MAG TPA: cytochrome c/FTR1 family iron permease [Gemmatimonadales bacterium]|jgi:high-affinity iron transporter|nr:cytochrome c/FTR1 family iron permease [Gemmatimonadales bacterium]
MHSRWWRFVLVFLVTASAPPPLLAQGAATARRLATTVQLAAEEYRLGVQDGRIIAAAEVEETRLFLAEARRGASRLPERAAAQVTSGLDQLDAMVARLADPDSVDRRVSTLLTALASQLKIELDEIPAEVPSLARGREIYQTTCASCHGAAGRGDGPQAAALSPPPANLADPAALAGSSPLDFYRRITVGTAGTAMAPYEHILSAKDRWAVALYSSVLRLPRPGARVPAQLRSFATTARMSDAEVLAALGPAATAADLAAVRTLPSQPAGAMGAVFAAVRRQLDSAYGLARRGLADEARTMAMDAYLSFERVERELLVKDPKLTSQIEAAFASLRTRAGSGATPEQLGGIREDLARALERAERTIGDRPPASGLFMQSFVILVREGLEAILVIGALMAFLVRTGNAHRRRDIHLGVGAAILMSLLTAAALETVFALSPAHQEGLEGAVMLLAMVTLFYVSYWLLSKLEVAKWNRFVRGRIESALSRGSALALASVAFLAVYREGFETVLFYKALAVSGGGGGGAGDWVPIGLGILGGAGVLAGVYVAINRFGVRLPLKPLFGVTSALLYYMAFVFAGKAVAELQEAGVLPLTPVGWAPRVPGMGIYPTMESLALQGLLLLLALIGLVWVFGVEPRRLRAAPVVPEVAPEPTRKTEGETEPEQELLHSIDRIEADLAEVRSELERMRERVIPEDATGMDRGRPHPRS